MSGRWTTALAAILAVAACGGADDGGEERLAVGVEAGDFCAPILERVDSFVVANRGAPASELGERYGGTAVASGGGDLTGLNPIVAQDYTTVQHQNFAHLMTLIRYDEELVPRPYLAESWEVNEDSTAITFHLRDDVYWHDGVKTTAEDVAFTYRLMNDPEAAFANVSYWDQYAKGPDAVEVVDSFTVTVRMLRPHAEFLDPWRTSSILPRHVVSRIPPAEMAQHPYGQECSVGNGPFVFAGHRVGESWAFAANPAFPDALGGRPYLDRLVYRVIAQPATALSELLTGGVHFFSQPPPEYADEIIAADDAELLSFAHRTYTFVGWNTRRETLSDPRVRRAVTLALDREEMVEALLGGYATVTQGTVPPWHWAIDESIADALPHDPPRARALLDDAGWVDRDGDGVRENAEGTPLSIEIKYNGDNRIRANIAEIMQSRLAGVGIEAKPTAVEYQTLLNQVTDPEQRDFDGIVLGFTNEFKLDDRAIFHSASADEVFGFVGLEDPRMDRLIDTLQVVVDREAARGLWSDYQELLVELQPFTFLFFADRLAGVRTSLRGVEMDVRGEWLSVRDWWIDPAARDGTP